MNVFLMLSSSAVAFYVFILLALWRDNRKRRNGHVLSCSSSDFDEVWGLTNDRRGALSHSKRFKFSDDVLWVPISTTRLGARRQSERPESKPVLAAASRTSSR